MAKCKLPEDSCIKERRKAMSFPVADPRNYLPSPCLNCKVGLERQMEKHVPEPDPVDDPSKLKRPFKIEPTPCVLCGVIVKKPSYRTRPICKPCYYEEKRAKAAKEREKYRCAECGACRTKYAKLCNACYKRSRTVPAICIHAGCSNKTKRKGLCERHYFQVNNPAEVERKRKANLEAVKRYREKGNRIAQNRMSKPKNHITKYREVPE